MGKMSVNVDAWIDGKTCKFGFDWHGGPAEVEQVMAFIEEVAVDAGMTPEAFAQATVRQLPSMGPMEERDARQVQAMAILYLVLQFPTTVADRPGAIYRYAGDEEITANLTVRD